MLARSKSGKSTDNPHEPDSTNHNDVRAGVSHMKFAAEKWADSKSAVFS